MKPNDHEEPADPFAETARSPAESSSAGGSSDGEDPRVFQVIKQYMAALDAGKRPSRQDLIARHPDIAAELSDALDGLAFIHSAAAKMVGPVNAPESDPLDPSAHGGDGGVTGKALGDFQLVKEIGRGGMGVVYEAIQLSLGRRVAVKVLPMAAAFDERHLQRFRNEAQAAAQLHHTNIVPVYAVGCERSVHFYAMQLIEGQSLELVIRELRYAAKAGAAGARPAAAAATPSTTNGNGGASATIGSPAASAATSSVTAVAPARSRPPHKGRGSSKSITPVLDYAVPSDSLTELRSGKRATFYQQVARLGLQAAEALEYAHRLGIVHRDVKPANLLLDRRGNLWVTDFGLAQLYAESNLTQTGDMIGTLRYMSPEQASGKAVVLDQRADIYSLGATLYELLTLERAVLGDTREQLLRELSTVDPRPPRSIDKSIPIELDTILMKATAKAPADRYPSCAALAEDLQRFLSDEPILARPPSVLDKAIKWTRRHKSVAVSAVVVLVLASVGLAATTFVIAREQAKTKTAYGQLTREQDKTKAAYDLERQRATEANEQRARAEKSFQDARQVVDFYTNLAATEMNDPPFRDVRKRMLEVGLDYYQGFLAERQNDPTIAAQLAAAQTRVEGILTQLETFDDLARAVARLRLLSEKSVKDELKVSDEVAEKAKEAAMHAGTSMFGGGGPGGGGGPRMFSVRKLDGGPGPGGGPRGAFGGGFGGGPDGPGVQPGDSGGPPPMTDDLKPNGGGGPREKLSPETVNQRIAAGATEAEKALKDLLTTPQLDRLRQVSWQVWGPMAFGDPDVVKVLSLTQAQKTVVANVQGPFRDMRRVFGGGGGGPGGGGGGGGPRSKGDGGGGGGGNDGQVPLDSKGAVERITATFTPAQSAAWADLIGAPFKGDVDSVNPTASLFMMFGPRTGGGGFGHEKDRDRDHGPGGPGGEFGRFERFEMRQDRSTSQPRDPQ